MSRVIKFRAWDVENLVMIDESYNDDHYILTIEQCKPVLLEYAGDDYARYVEIKSDIQQFTGFKDKNGLEIYEGDILIGSISTSKRHMLVKFIDDVASFVVVDKIYGPVTISQEKINSFELFVSGNIHENPELLSD